MAGDNENKLIKGAPVTLWLDGKSKTVFPIDAQAWRDNGWGEDPETKSLEPDPKSKK